MKYNICFKQPYKEGEEVSKERIKERAAEELGVKILPAIKLTESENQNAMYLSGGFHNLPEKEYRGSVYIFGEEHMDHIQSMLRTIEFASVNHPELRKQIKMIMDELENK